MRIIAGTYKNRLVHSPEGMKTRPMLARVRKSIMDILQPHLENAKVLDLFSGSGIFSFESLSRGAASSLCVEAGREACHVIKDNQKRICPKDRFHLVQGDVLKTLPTISYQNGPFDVIGITPPYNSGLEDRTLELIAECPSLLHNETVIFAQHFHLDDIRTDWEHLEHIRTKKYGKTKVEFFMKRLEEKSNNEE